MMKVAKKPALLIIDMQNDFVRAGAPMEVPDAREILPGLQRMARAFRAADLPVVFARYVASDGYAHLRRRLTWLDLQEPPILACRPGHLRRYDDVPEPRDAVAVVDELAPGPSDMVIDKPYYSAFFGTDLEPRLRLAAVDGLVITGTLTEMCVEDSARHAVHHGFHTALVSDGVASNSPERHAAALAAFEENYGWVLSCDEVLSDLQSAGRGAVDGAICDA